MPQFFTNKTKMVFGQTEDSRKEHFQHENLLSISLALIFMKKIVLLQKAFFATNFSFLNYFTAFVLLKKWLASRVNRLADNVWERTLILCVLCS